MDVLRDDLAYFIIVEIVNQNLIGIGSYEVPKLRFQSCENDQRMSSTHLLSMSPSTRGET
jgi:hypothetical protein